MRIGISYRDRALFLLTALFVLCGLGGRCEAQEKLRMLRGELIADTSSVITIGVGSIFEVVAPKLYFPDERVKFGIWDVLLYELVRGDRFQIMKSDFTKFEVRCFALDKAGYLEHGRFLKLIETGEIKLLRIRPKKIKGRQ